MSLQSNSVAAISKKIVLICVLLFNLIDDGKEMRQPDRNMVCRQWPFLKFQFNTDMNVLQYVCVCVCVRVKIIRSNILSIPFYFGVFIS